MEANQQTEEMLSKDTGTKKFVYDGQEFPDTPYFRNLVKRREEREAEGPGTFKEAMQTIAEVAPITGDAIAVYNLPSDLRKAYELIQQGYTEGDIKDIGLGAGLAGLSALGVVPVLGTGAKIAKKGLRATIDDALVQTEDLFRTASGMDGPDSMAMATTAPSRVTGNVADDALPDTSITKIIIGKSGKDHAEKEAKYNTAKQQLTGGRSAQPDEAQELWNRTGAQEDLVHGDVVYEIPTVNARLKEDELTKTVFPELDFSKKKDIPDDRRVFKFEAAPDAQITVGEIVDFPELFEQAPYLKDITVKKVPIMSQLKGTNAAYDDVENILYLSSGTKKDLMSSTLHELEHAVQKADDFTYRGSNLNNFLGPDTGYDASNHKRLIDAREQVAVDLNEAIKKYYGKDKIGESKYQIIDAMKMLSDVYSPKLRKRFIQIIDEMDERKINNLKSTDIKDFKASLPEHVRDVGKSLSDFDYKFSVAFLKRLTKDPIRAQTKGTKSPLDLILDTIRAPDFQDLTRFDELKQQAVIKYMRDPGEVTARNVQFRFLASQADPSITRVAPRFTEDKSISPGGGQSKSGIPETKTAEQLREEVSRQGVDLTPTGTYISRPDELALMKGRSAAEQTDNMISVFPKPERMFPEGERPKGGDYINTQTGDVLSGRNVSSANIKINPDGRPSFKVSDDDVSEVGSTGKGKSNIKVNLFKKKAGWKWEDAPDEFKDIGTLVSVEHKGKHFYTLETDFSKGVALKKYPDSKSEPRLRPTVVGNIEMGEQVGSISVRGKQHPVYGKIITYAKGGAVPMDRQMDMFDNGGLMDQGGSIDPVSGNDVPVGSLQEEVRDDIPAMLSEGEFVMPADVVRYHGLDKMMALRDEAKLGLARMEAMGQMGNAEEAIIPDEIPFGLEDLDIADDPLEMQVGGFVPQQQPYGTFTQPAGTNTFSVPSQFAQQPVFGGPVPFQQPFQQTPVMPVFGPGQPTGEPKETFTFDQLMPTSSGTSETREYRNADGESLYIPFINGEPIYPIPAGYFPYTPETTPDPTPDPATTTGQAVREEDPSRMTPEEQKRRQESDERIRKRKAAAKELGYTKEASAIGQMAKLLIPGAGLIAGKEESGTIMPDGSIADGAGNTFDPITGEQIGGKGFLGFGKEDFPTTEGARNLGVTPASQAGLMNIESEKSLDEFRTSSTVTPEATQVETAQVESTLQATNQAGQTASGQAKEKVKALNDIMNALNVPESQKMDYLVKVAARQGNQTFATGPDGTGALPVDFSTFSAEDSAAAQEILNVVATRGNDALKSMLSDSQERADITPTRKTTFAPIDTEGVVEEETRIQQTRVARNQRIQEEAEEQTQNYRNRGYSETAAKQAGQNKARADDEAREQTGEPQAKAVTDKYGNPVRSGSDGSVVTSNREQKDDSPEPDRRWCCSQMVHRGLWTQQYEFARLTVWSSKQPDWWKSGYHVWGKVLAKTFLRKKGFWTDVMQSFYDYHIRKKPYTWRTALAHVMVYPGVFICGNIWTKQPKGVTLASFKELNG
jgi:hypothetical protein